MKNRLIITLITFSVSCASFADTCPPINGLDPQNPPPGWSLLLPPIIPDQTYHFGSAIHSLNGSFYYNHVICLYQACPSWGCPSFELLSDNTFDYPNAKAPPWNQRPVIGYTLVCTPPNHDPSVCVFH